MRSNGGLTTVQCSRVFHAWQSIILQFPVRRHYLSHVQRSNVLSTVVTSVDVGRLFSKGRIALPYICNQLPAQSTRAQLCLGQWCKLNLVKDVDIRKAVSEAVAPSNQGEELAEGSDKISLAA